MSEKSMWDEFASNYDDTVYSLTQFEIRRKKIISQLTGNNVLIVGCGSTTYLEQHLIQEGYYVTAADYSSKMIDVARSRFNHANLQHIIADMTNLGFADETYDHVIATNSILPEYRIQIQPMFDEIYRVLNNGGSLVGYFPSFDYCTTFYTENMDESELHMYIDPIQMRVWEEQGWQCFHTEQSLLDDLACAGFSDCDISVDIFNTQEEISEIKRLYDLDVSRMPVEEYFVVASK